VTEFAIQRSLAQPSVDFSRQFNTYGFSVRTQLHVYYTAIQARDLYIMCYRHWRALISKKTRQLALDRVANRVTLCGLKAVKHQLIYVQLN
jgi:hypothetical protein